MRALPSSRTSADCEMNTNAVTQKLRHKRPVPPVEDQRARRRQRTGLLWMLLPIFLAMLSGCSAIYHPYTKTIEHKMEVLNRMPRSQQRKLDPRLLSQTPPHEHLVDDGDILGVYIEGAPGQDGVELPVRFAADSKVAPTVGYPTPVRSGGFIRIPQVGALHVRGMTTAQIEEQIRRKLVGTNKEIQPDKDRIHVSLMWTRSVNVMVIRQEETSTTHIMAPTNGPDADRRSGEVVNLPVFQNDVLHALMKTGGLPNNQAENAVYVFKRTDRVRPGMLASAPPNIVPTNPTTKPFAANHIQQATYQQVVGSQLPVPSNPMPQLGHSLSPVPTGPGTTSGRYGGYDASNAYPTPQPAQNSMNAGIPPRMMHMVEQYPSPAQNAALPCGPENAANSPHPNALRIPLDISDDQPVAFGPNDVILEDGDIILVESREDDSFFTGGLLGGGQYSLPRNTDLDVLDAVLLADSYSRSSQVNTPTRAIGGVSVLNRDVTVGASRVVVERKTPEGSTARFRVNLYKAMRNPDQRVIIEPGDRVYLEYTAIEAVLAFFERHLLDPVTTGAPALLTN